jgi:hypothetical protein
VKGLEALEVMDYAELLVEQWGNKNVFHTGTHPEDNPGANRWFL